MIIILNGGRKKAGECPIAPELAKIIEKEHAANLHKQTPFFLV